MSRPIRTLRHAHQVRAGLLMGLLFAVGSCAPEPVSLAGKLCSPARPCASGWECGARGTCRVTGTGNQVKNGDFESGVAGWAASGGTVGPLDAGHGPGGAARWAPDGTGESVLTLTAPAADAPATGNWCAQAWVQGSDEHPVDFEIVQANEVGDTHTGKASGGIWTRLEVTDLLVSREPLSVRLRSPADAGARQLVVDDVALWNDVGGDGCAVAP